VSDDETLEPTENLVEFRRPKQGSPDNRPYRVRKQEPVVKPRTPTHGFVPGMQLICRIGKAQHGGYAVTITKGNHEAFLPSFSHLNEGDEVLAYYVGTLDHNILLEEKFPQRRRPVEKIESPFKVIEGGGDDSAASGEEEGVETVQVSFEDKIVSLKFMSKPDEDEDSNADERSGETDSRDHAD
jgi:hypothetical protein